MNLKEQLATELAAMEQKKQTFMQSYWQADGACQAIAGALRMIEQAEQPATSAEPKTN